jgi:pimeloyl-ACP methyl ester carboxylesterase
MRIAWLHGGPGTAQIGFARHYMKDLEQDFVVVNWDQRGAGLSYSRRIPKESFTIDQFIEDTRVVCEWLLQWSGQEKLFVVGHSWGTLLGTMTAARYPHLFHAYVGMGQVASMADNEAVSYRFTLEQAKQRGNARAVKDLERIGPPPYRNVMDVNVERKWLRKFGGVIRQGSMAKLIFSKMFFSTEYTLPDTIKMGLGNIATLVHMWDELMTVNLPVQVPQLQMPVYYILGRYDMNCPSELAVDYFGRLQAPSKELFWMENSAHFIFGEEPQEFTRVMRKVLQDHRRRTRHPHKARRAR